MLNNTKTLILCVVSAIVAVSLIDYLATRSIEKNVANNEDQEHGNDN